MSEAGALPQQLSGLRVVDFTRALSGPFCAQMLGDMGAEVIKVEAREGGDDSRSWGPPFIGDESTYFFCANRNKRSLTLDLKKGQEVARRLLERADVIIENFSPGTMKRLGLGYDQVIAYNPEVIYCSISGYGQDGPGSQLPGYDMTAQGAGGLMSVTGHDGPTRVGVSVADISTGMFCAYAIMTALFHRQRGGKGQYIDTSLVGSVVALMTHHASAYLNAGKVAGLQGNTHSTIAPYETLPTRDGYINLGVANERLWQRFCACVGLEHLISDPRFASNASRVTNRKELAAIVTKQFAECSTAELVTRLQAAGVPADAIRPIDEVFADPQVQHLGLRLGMEHATAGHIEVAGLPYRLSLTPGTVRLPPPTLGQHNAAVLSDLGYSAQDVERFRETQVI
ncbi:MAG: CaiB/BaiF CoA transferase family protein [Chloroflexota bacterium]